MPDLDFTGLRESVEASTDVPEFRTLAKRARRHRRRRRLAAAAKILGVLSVATPGLVIGGVIVDRVYHSSAVSVAGLSGDHQISIGPTATTTPVTRTVVAAAGADLSDMYGLVDVCAGAGKCNLQLSSITSATEAGTTMQLGLLRAHPADTLTDPRMTIVNATTVIISAVVNRGTRQYAQIKVPAVSGDTAFDAVRPIQTTAQGAIRTVGAAAATPTTLSGQPPVTLPTLQSTNGGWWVSGVTPDTGELAISVSRDHGSTWKTRSLGVLPDSTGDGASGGPVLATANGADVYVLLRSGGQMILIRSTDGGATWASTGAGTKWPATQGYGLIVRPDGSLLAWFGDTTSTTFLSSHDGGQTFKPEVDAAAPSGPIVPMPGGGYVTLGAQPAISRDGTGWASAYVPYITIQ